MSYATSEQTNEIAKALSVLQSKCGGMGRSGNNTHLRSKYAMLPDCWEVIRPNLAPNGLAIVQAPFVDGDSAGVTTQVLHSSGQWIRTVLTLPVIPGKGVTKVQSIGSATSYAKRYALMALCGLAEDEHDDDGNAAGAQPQQRQQEPPRQPAAPPPEVLDDLHAHILQLIPNLPEEAETAAEKAAKGFRESGNFDGLQRLLRRTQEVLKEGVAG